MEFTELLESVGIEKEFAAKAGILFNAKLEESVSAKLAVEVVSIQEAAEKRLDEAKQEFITAQSESIDEMLESVVVSWIEANSASLDTKIKSEVLDSLVNSLKESFSVSGVSIPEFDGKALVESASKKNAENEASIESLSKELAEAKEKLDSIDKSLALAELTEGLSDIASDKVLKLAEAFKHQDLEKFKESVSVVVEAFAPKKKESESATGEDPEKTDKGVDTEPKSEIEGKESEEVKAAEKAKKMKESTDPLIAATLKLMSGKK
jgi:hypothetical protein